VTFGEEGGSPHVAVGAPPDPDQKIGGVWVLVVIHPDGGEGIYGQVIDGPRGPMMVNFVFPEDYLKERFEELLREQGTLEVMRRDGKRAEWRYFDTIAEVDVLVGP
jgi:hypothetical protein